MQLPECSSVNPRLRSQLTSEELHVFGKKMGLKLIGGSPKQYIQFKGNCIYLYHDHVLRNYKKTLHEHLVLELRSRIMYLIGLWEEKLELYTEKIIFKKMRKSWVIRKEKNLTCNVYCLQLPERIIEFMLVEALLAMKYPQQLEREQQLTQFFPDFILLADQLNYEYNLHQISVLT